MSHESITYQNALPPHLLGTEHESLASFTNAVSASSNKQTANNDDVPTEFSLVVILSRNAKELYDDNGGGGGSSSSSCIDRCSSISILLGKKLRGFGKGFFNCFGGKLEKSRGEHDHPATGAVREIYEETGINIPLSVMENGFVGKINFTFEDSDVNRAMRVHLYCVFVELSPQEAVNENHDQSTDTSISNDNASPLHINGHEKSTNGNSTRTKEVKVDPKNIRGCDEIEPHWFHNIHDIPLDQMFADDSLWLTRLLSHYNLHGGHMAPKFMFDAWFHFHPGGTKTNSIMHHFIQINDGTTDTVPFSKHPPKKYTFEKRLFHELHLNHIHSPSIKEFKENWAMANSVRKFMKEEHRMEYVLDVAGGHGALGALFLLLVPACHTAVVIDPAKCTSGKKGVRDAWSQFWTGGDNVDTYNKTDATTKKKELRYLHECLRTGLRKELDCILQTTKSTNVTVVACHACQHLTDETLQIASEYGVNVAVLPCCQKDHDGWWKGLANHLVSTSGNDKASLSIGALMDILAAGKMMGWETGATAGVRYQVKMKLMNASISLQNRMILCKALNRNEDDTGSGNIDRQRKKELAHEKLTRAYKRAHQLTNEGLSIETAKTKGEKAHWCIHSLMVGVCFGASLSFFVASRLQKGT